MQNRYLKIALFFVLPLFAFVKADWVEHKLDQKASISFPVAPVEFPYQNFRGWRHLTDSSLLMAIPVSMAATGEDVELFKKEFNKPETLKAFREGVLQSMSAGKFISEKIAQTSGYPSYDIVFEIGGSLAMPKNMLVYTKSVFIEGSLYGLYYFEAKGTDQKKDRDQFFGSFKYK
jgi:hypothetical protein